MTASHDGHIFIWDLTTGLKIKSFYNTVCFIDYFNIYQLHLYYNTTGLSFAAFRHGSCLKVTTKANCTEVLYRFDLM